MAVLKNVENKIKLVMVVSSLFLIGCIIVSLGSFFIAKGMVDDAHKKVYVLDGNVPILVKQTTMDETFDVEAKSDIEMFHQFSSLSHRMTSISNIRCARQCISLTRPVWHSIMP